MSTYAIDMVQRGYLNCLIFADEVSKQLEWCEKEVDILIEANLPEKYHFLAKQILHSIPEILVTASIFTGVGVPVATFFWSMRIVWISFPLLKALVTGDGSIDSLSKASGECLVNLFKAYEKFKPAIAVCGTVAAVVYFAKGWASLDYAQMLKGSLLLIIAQGMAALIEQEKHCSRLLPMSL